MKPVLKKNWIGVDVFVSFESHINNANRPDLNGLMVNMLLENWLNSMDLSNLS
jgi:hypothetical protein